MSINASLYKNPDELCFENFPENLISYQKAPPPSALRFIKLPIYDTISSKTLSVYVWEADLQALGISGTIARKYQTTPQNFPILFQNTTAVYNCLQKASPIITQVLPHRYHSLLKRNVTWFVRTICGQQAQGTKHFQGTSDMPGLYFDTKNDITNIFLSTRTPALGSGTYGKVSKACWLTAPSPDQIVIAKKKSKAPEDKVDGLTEEAKILAKLRNQRGVISMICSDNYDGKQALFLPLYDCNFSHPSMQHLSESDLLFVIDQLLEGLEAMAKHGTHADIKDANILLRRNADHQLEAVFTDFGAFRGLTSTEKGICIDPMMPPEHLLDNQVNPKQDVWALGLVLLQKFCKRELDCWNFEIEDRKRWLQKLKFGWPLKYLDPDTPEFVKDLLCNMLHPNGVSRCSARKARRHYRVDYVNWLTKKQAQAEQKT